MVRFYDFFHALSPFRDMLTCRVSRKKRYGGLLMSHLLWDRLALGVHKIAVNGTVAHGIRMR